MVLNRQPTYLLALLSFAALASPGLLRESALPPLHLAFRVRQEWQMLSKREGRFGYLSKVRKKQGKGNKAMNEGLILEREWNVSWGRCT
jgi:hypothetical protein